LEVFSPPEIVGQPVEMMRHVCESGLLRCMPVARVVSSQEVEPGVWQFTVEFEGEDGELFVLGPCCGATEEEMPPLSQFVYTVRQGEEGWRVQELPVYVP
jgi:hypothetical protein